VSAAAEDLHLKSSRFRAEREDDWKRLERLLARVERGSLRSLSADEIVSLTVLYRATLSSLSVARATSLDRAVVEYLESLSTRAYFFVYGARTGFLSRLARFFTVDWPLAVQGLWRESLVALLITVLGDPAASVAALRRSLYGTPDFDSVLSTVAAQLFNHNARIVIFAFALGFAFGVPTVMLLLYNGCMLGAFLALYFTHGLGFEVVGWLFIHGVTELSAIILAGAAGMKIGWTLAFPGARSRADAAGAAGREAALVMCGAVIMLFFAGILESFARTLITNDWARYAVASLTAAIWGAYFYWPRRRLSDG
jgi:uncharacterized membrane protein SpoIIM required for sporulation